MENVKENIVDKVGKENATDYMTTIRNFCDYLKDEVLEDENKSIILRSVFKFKLRKCEYEVKQWIVK